MMVEEIDADGYVSIKYRRFDMSLIKMDNLKGALDLQAKLNLGVIRKHPKGFVNLKSGSEAKIKPSSPSMGLRVKGVGGSLRKTGAYFSQPNLLAAENAQI